MESVSKAFKVCRIIRRLFGDTQFLRYLRQLSFQPSCITNFNLELPQFILIVQLETGV